MSSSPTKCVFDYVTFKDDIPSHFLCYVCEYPIIEAEMATPCGHSFCGSCVRHIKENNVNLCQYCKEPVDSFCKNVFAKNMLSTAEGKCNGCLAVFQLDTAKQHVQSCVEIERPCRLCSMEIKRKEETAHRDVCPMREIVCGCGAKIKKNEEESHKEMECRFKEMPSPLMCGETIKRYLIAGHCLQCLAVVKVCPVKGCGSVVQRGVEEEHIRENQMRHFSLLAKDRKKILWQVEKKVWMNITPKPTGEVAVFKWNLPTPRVAGPKRSPQFEKFKKKWCVLYTDEEVGVEYVQGVDPIHMDICFIITTGTGNSSVYNLKTVGLAEGKQAKTTLSLQSPDVKQVIIKMALLEPEYC